MQRLTAPLAMALILSACSSHDPILPGTRTAIFQKSDVVILNSNVPNAPEQIAAPVVADCPYRQDASNVVWHGDKKIFSGFATPNSVKSNQTPVCSGKYVYAGLTTGELVKIDATTRRIVWIADIYRTSNMTGGASMTDIIAPIVVRGNWVYAGGIGDAFCKIKASDGTKIWCANISVAVPFLVTDGVSYVVGGDNYLYAIRDSDGAAYWRASVDAQVAPTYENKTITVGKTKINAETGK